MNPLSRRLAPVAVQAFTSRRSRNAQRWLAERRRRLRGEPHRVLYFHQAGDPYGHLALQVLGPLVERYEVQLEPHLAGPPSDATAPERALLTAFALRDAADVAPGYGLSFPAPDAPPADAAVELAERRFAAAIEAGDFIARAPEISGALWRAGGEDLNALAAAAAPVSAQAARAAIATGSERREALGHYLGGMLYYGGEWYWGVDRLWHLERRLQALGLLRPGSSAAPIAPRPEPSGMPLPAGEGRVTLEYFPSLRSPYTAIAMRRVADLRRRLPVDLVVRPVLPMVMRGLPVPRIKSRYIVTDTKREAEDAGVDFGRVCDPVGRPVERGFSLYPAACEQGVGFEFLQSFTDGVFCQGIDAGSEDGLRTIAERAGLAWDRARPFLDREGWREPLEANRKSMFASGLWGVPSFRIPAAPGAGEYATWGQDRIWRVEQELRRRLQGAA